MSSRLGIGKLWGKGPSSLGRAFLGTAFLVSGEFAVTCFHCIGNLVDGSIFFTNLEVVLDEDVIRVELHYGDPHLDFHVLRILDRVPSEIVPIPLSVADPGSLPFRSIGYPSEIEGPDRMVIDGEVTSQSSKLFGASAMQLFCRQAAAGMQLNGMSGAPVLVGRPEAAVGCIRWNPVRSQSFDTAVGGIVFACPVAQMIDRCRDLVKCEIRQTRNAKVALDPATIPALQRRYGFIRERQLQSSLDFEWRGIPVLEYSTPRQLGILDSVRRGLWQEVLRQCTSVFRRNTAGIEEKLLALGTKHLLNLAAVGTAELSSQSSNPFASVLLVRASRVPNRFNYELVSPHAELVAFIQDHLPPRLSARDSQKVIEKSGMLLEWKGGVPIGVLFPVTVLCDHGRKRVLIMNENQLFNPTQFLDPHKCDTTSGFLNFVGTFSYLTAKYPSAPTIVEFSNVEKAFENLKIKAWQNWLYQFMDTAVIFDANRLFVRCDNPEEYFYFQSVKLLDDASPNL